MITLKGEIREGKTKLAQIRKEGFIPGVYYGHKEKATPCVFPMNEFVKVWKEAGESTVITLEMPKGKVSALIHEVQKEPIRGLPIHVDFYVIEKGAEVTVHTPIEFVGVSEAVKSLGGTLVKVLHELEIKALPENLPHNVVVDISKLDTLDSQVLAKDIVLSKGVTLITDPEDVVVAIAVGKDEPVEAPAMDISQIEVEKKGKKEEEGEAPAEK